MPDQDNKQGETNQGGIIGGIKALINAAKGVTGRAKHEDEKPADNARQAADAARQASENARKQQETEAARKAAEDARHKADWARIEAESAQRAAEALRAEQQQEPQGSGGVNSEDQLDAIRRGYIERGLADPSGLTANSDSVSSNLDVDVSAPDSGIRSNLDPTYNPTDEDNSQRLTGGRDLG